MVDVGEPRVEERPGGLSAVLSRWMSGDGGATAVAERVPPAPVPPPARMPGAARAWSRASGGLAEAVVAVGAAVVSVVLAGGIVVDPTDRLGRVSGVAALDLRFALLALVVLAGCLAAVRASARVWRFVTGICCAAVSGLVTGLIAGGVVVALRGTVWPLNANSGDSGQLVRWAEDLLAGRPLPASYPPMVIELIAAIADLTGQGPAAGLRAVQVVGTALFGPIAYLAWRLLLRPGWALAITLVAALPLIEPYKPYTTVVLVALVPVLVGLLRAVRRAATASWTRVLAVGGLYGVALGALFSLYSGWFVWSAPGAIVAALVLVPWRKGALRGLAMLGVAAAGLSVVAAEHLVGLLSAAGTVRDRYFYFDTFVDPGYIAMWRNDLPGDVGTWPPPGELAGVGLFSVLLVVGLGVAVAAAGRRTVVVTLCLLLAGAWVVRLWIASQMWATQSVQLYPRTTAEILFCLLALCVLAAMAVTERAAPMVRQALPGRARWSNHRSATVGGLCAALLLGLFAGSSTADRYMPANDGTVGRLAYAAQFLRQPDGTCPTYTAVPNRCVRDLAWLPHREEAGATEPDPAPAPVPPPGATTQRPAPGATTTPRPTGRATPPATTRPPVPAFPRTEPGSGQPR